MAESKNHMAYDKDKACPDSSISNTSILLNKIREYWNANVHDSKISNYPLGSKEFFNDLKQYHFDKLNYLPKIVDFRTFKGKALLEIGCGVGIDLAEFARNGANVTGIDISERSIELTRRNFKLNGLEGKFKVMDGEMLEFDNESFDVVYAHGVVQYTANPSRMIKEIYRVLKPGGEAIITVYNRYSWLNILAIIARVNLEHEDAPVLRKYSTRKFKSMLTRFSELNIIVERFPVKTGLHHGFKGFLYNTIFVSFFNLIPRFVTRPLGWHIVARAIK